MAQKHARVMISYSRRDKEFTKKVYDNLISNGMSPDDVWVDWEGIPLSADWMAEITKGIQQSDAFIFIISPDSLTSEVCDKEVQIAVDNNKRLVPILHREPEKGNPMPARISATNWVYMREQDDFDATLPDLIESINTDLEWVAEHTRIQGKALEWEREEKKPAFTLRGEDLAAGENFITTAAGGKEPQPTSLQAEYVSESRVEDRKRRRNTLIGVSIALVVSIFLGVTAYQQFLNATDREQARATQQSIAQTQAVIADNNAATAVANESIALTQEAIAIENGQISLARSLAAQSVLQRESDPQLSLALVLYSYQLTAPYGMILPETQAGLYSNLQQPNILKTYQGDLSSFFRARWSPDETKIATLNYFGTVQIWDRAAGEIEYTMSDLEASAVELVYSPDGSFLASGDFDGNMFIWNASTGSLMNKFQAFDEGCAITGVEFLSNNKELVAADACHDGIRVFDVENGEMAYEIVHPTDYIYPYSIAVSPDDRYLAIADQTNLIYTYDLKNKGWGKSVDVGDDTDVIWADDDGIRDLEFSNDSQLLGAANSYNNGVFVWSVENWEMIFSVEEHTSTVFSLDFSPDGNYLATAGSDVYIWSLQRSALVHRLSGHQGDIRSVEFNGDGSQLITTGNDGKIISWQLKSAGQNFTTFLPLDGMSHAAIHPNGQQILTGGESGGPIVWGLYDGSYIKEYELQDHVSTSGNRFDQRISRVGYSQDGEWVIVTTLGEGVFIFEEDTGELIIQIEPDTFWNFALSRDKSMLVTSTGFQASVYDTATGEKIIDLEHPILTETFDLAFNHDDTRLLVTGLEIYENNNQMGSLVVFEVGSWEAQIAVQSGRLISSGTFSEDGSRIITGTDGFLVLIWDAISGEQMQVLQGHSGWVRHVAFSPDGKLAISASNDKTVIIWDISTGLPLYTFPGFGEQFNTIEFTPDTQKLVVADSGGFYTILEIDYKALIAGIGELEIVDLSPEECQLYLGRPSCELSILSSSANP